jgi:hypothetical protein
MPQGDEDEFPNIHERGINPNFMKADLYRDRQQKPPEYMIIMICTMTLCSLRLG